MTTSTISVGEVMGCLYMLTSPSGKSYIGISSKTAAERWRVHLMRVREGRANALQLAIRKYGADNFKLKTLIVADDFEYLCEMERRVIGALNTKAPNGYNLTDGGEGVAGKVLTDAARENMAAAQRKRFQNEEQLALNRERLARGRETSKQKCAAKRVDGMPAWIRKKKASTLKSTLGEEAAKAEHSRRTREAMARPDVHAKTVACAKQRAASPEWRKKIGDAGRGVPLGPLSELAKSRISEARRREWADPEMRAKRLAAFVKARQAKASKKT